MYRIANHQVSPKIAQKLILGYAPEALLITALKNLKPEEPAAPDDHCSEV